ncbi:MAG TPA: hypothetical protein VKQ52_11545 [Puia sp.]|nr:hypothetical protein [Puia sp.]
MKDQKRTQPKNPAIHDPSRIQHKTPRKASIENPDKNDQPDPGKEIRIDDDPDQTKRKIPVSEDPRRKE